MVLRARLAAEVSLSVVRALICVSRRLLSPVSDRRRLNQCYRRSLPALEDALTKRSAELATENRLRRGVAGFAERVAASLDELNFEGRQRLLRLVVEKVRVTGWRVEIHLTIPLPDQPPPDEHRPNDGPPDNDPKKSGPEPAEQLSSDMRLRSLRVDDVRLVGDAVHDRFG